MTEADRDAIERLRARLTEVDESIVAAVNARIELVRELKRVKAEQGIGFLDPERERALVEHLEAANAGPLSSAGLRALYAELLALTKREV